MQEKSKSATISVAWQALAAETLDGFAILKQGWDGYAADAPSAIAIHNAREFLHTLHIDDPSPTRIAPSVVGGVGITFRDGAKKAYVEFYNDGLTHLLYSGAGDDVSTHPVETENGYQSLVNEIRQHLHV
jgi:hypothetical protein